MSEKDELDPSLKKIESQISQACPPNHSLDPLSVMYKAGWNAAIADSRNTNPNSSEVEEASKSERATTSPRDDSANQDRANFWRVVSAVSSAAAILFLALFISETTGIRESWSNPSNIVETKPNPLDDLKKHIGDRHSNSGAESDHLITGSSDPLRMLHMRKQSISGDKKENSNDHSAKPKKRKSKKQSSPRKTPKLLEQSEGDR